MKAVVTGAIATFPVGGVAWDYGQYALGLERLGFDVYYLEDTGLLTFDPLKGEYGEDAEYGVRFLQESLAALSPSLGRSWRFCASDGRSYGMDAKAFADVLGEAGLFLNVSGLSLLRDEYMRCPRKILIDTDPGWNQFVTFPKWDAKPGWLGTHGYRGHDYFFTYAERVGQPDCPLPSLGLDWHPTRPPVVLDCWGAAEPGQTWTTVMSWDNYQRPIEYDGVTYGSKEAEFARIETLPSRVAAPLELAVGGVRPPMERLRNQGWSVIDSVQISQTAQSYRSYIERSRGEFSVAKNVYVATRSGWFSCRSVCYLAAGRPAVVQDTGFSERIPTGEGLLAFSGLEEAQQAIERVECDYDRHSQAARALAREHFAAERVLSELIDQIGLE
jgi:hypothetical protein